MQSVYKLVSTVNQFYREINPSTLSGAIDVIVVKQPDGELACSPFHVRFGKLSVLRPQEKKVEITVNGKVVDFPMKIGEAGEAFFVFETENRVPEELQTSPLAGPTSTGEEPDFFDLNTENSKENALKNKDEQINTNGSDFGTEDGYEGDAEQKVFVADPKHVDEMKVEVPSEIITPASPTSEEGTIIDEVATPTTTPDEFDYGEQNKPVLNEDIIHEVEEKLATDNKDIKLELNAPDSLFLISDVIDSKPESLEKLYLEIDNASNEKHIEDKDINEENNVVININGDLNDLADIAVVPDLKNNIESDLEAQRVETQKIEEIRNTQQLEIETKQNRERVLSMPAVHPNWEKSEGPFSDTELEETRKPEKPLERRTNRTSPLSDTELDLEYGPKKPSKDSEEWSWGWGALPVRKSEKIEHWQNDTGNKDWNNDNTDEESHIEIGGKVHHFEISLCGSEAFGSHEQIDAEMFRKNQITYEYFSENPRILNDKSLVIKYNNRYYSWQAAAPIIASLIIFQKPLPDSTVANLSSNSLEGLGSSDQRRYSSLRGWSRWWSRSSSPLPPEKNDEKPKNNVEKEEEKPTKFYAKTLRLTSEQLKSLDLKKGANTISFTVPSSYQGKATCIAKLFFWDYDTKIVISDIDGTITKSDALGHVFTMIGKDWTHSGVAKLYTDITKNGYQILYLTSRAIGQADYTRDYLKKVEQDKYQLPDGPVIMSPDRLLTAFHREVIMRKPEVFKMACLRDVQKLFGDRNPFFAGFGNRITDALSYRSVNVPSSRIFTIDSNGEVKLQLLSGYKSSYVDLSDLVDQMFPHVGGRNWDTVYNDWNYWKPSLPEIEIPTEIYENPLKPSSPKSPNAVIGSPRLGMIRNLTGSSSNNKALIVLESPGNISPSSEKINENDPIIVNQRIVYVGGDVDMPGRMNITYTDENEKGSSIVDYDDEIDDGDDAEDEYVSDENDNNDEEEDSDFEVDIPNDIDFSVIPY